MSALAFELAPDLEAHEPPEVRGVARDGVRMLVARRSDGSIEHRTFSDLPELLAPGDVLAINVSATIPAAVPARRRDGEQVRVHFATRAPHLEDDWRVVEIRSADGSRPRRIAAGERLELRGGATLDLVAPYASGERLMLARFCCALLVDDKAPPSGAADLPKYLERHGEPIRYSHVSRPWPLEDYQNVYAISPGSAEMPSAGRPMTRELISRLVAREIVVAPITLHCGVSSGREPRAAVPRVVRGARADGAADRGRTRERRPRDRRRHHGRPRARVRRRARPVQLRARQAGPAWSSRRRAECPSSTA